MRQLLILIFTSILFSCQTNTTDKSTIAVTEAPKNFYYSIVFNDNDQFNSRDSSLSRSYNFGDTILKVGFTKAENEIIYTAICENNFFDLPKSIPLDTNKSFVIPSQTDRITVYIDGKVKAHVKFNRGGTPKDTVLAKRFDNVYNLMVNLITNTKEYKKLKPSNLISL